MVTTQHRFLSVSASIFSAKVKYVINEYILLLSWASLFSIKIVQSIHFKQKLERRKKEKTEDQGVIDKNIG